MLRIYYGDLEAENYIFNPDVFFNNTYEDEWITDPMPKQMIKDIDSSRKSVLFLFFLDMF